VKTLSRVSAVALPFLLACARGAPPPAELDTRNELCAYCRMPVSDRRLAVQIVSRGEEPLFFDDLGCLAGRLAGDGRRSGSAIYVADHGTGRWVPAESAVYTRSAVQTPMGSGLLAHADAASRDADPAARGGTPLRFEDTLRSAGAAPVSGGSPTAPEEEVPR
jgi:copper chaperone NosL